MTRDEAEKISNELVQKGMAEADAYIAAARAMLAALKEIDVVCNESRADLRRRMGTRVGNCMTIARAAMAQAEAAGIKAEG